MKKNVAGQKVRVFAFNRNTNVPVAGDAANITCKVSKDNGAATALGDVSPTETEDGYYLFDLTQAETNADTLDFYPESGTPDVQVIVTNHDRQTVLETANASVAPDFSGEVPFGLDGPVFALTGSASVVVGQDGSIRVPVGSTQSVAIECNQVVAGLSLVFVVETQSKVDVATVADVSITKAAATATLNLTSAMTASERTLRWSLARVSNGEAVAGGLLFVTYDAQGD